MVYYRCKCGKHSSYGSMGPALCRRCDECGSDLATNPDLHREPKPHDWRVEQVDTDNGKQPRTYCRYCLKTKAEIEAGGE